jgi:riboflavin kinase
LGYIRPEKDYSSVDALIKDIHIDIEVAKRSLQRSGYLTFKDNSFFEKVT